MRVPFILAAGFALFGACLAQPRKLQSKGYGLILTPEALTPDPRSEKYFNSFLYAGRASVPDSYSADDEGELLTSCTGQNNSIQLTQQDENNRLMMNDILGPPISEQEFRDSDDFQENPMDFREYPMEQGNLFEGDILGIPMDGRNGSSVLRVAKRDPNDKWPGAKIPYVISNRFPRYGRKVIIKAIKSFHDNTCIRFKRRSRRDSNYIHIIYGNDCSSYIGRVGGPQTLSLGKGCLNSGTVIHELMHAAGFEHEQSRFDRDHYVRIIEKNIHENMTHNFNKIDDRYYTDYESRYDYCSVMHYSAYAFSKDDGRLKTIVPLKRPNCKLGHKTGFSKGDIRKLNTHYQCRGYPQVIGKTKKWW